jgi:hypothetical protein
VSDVESEIQEHTANGRAKTKKREREKVAGRRAGEGESVRQVTEQQKVNEQNASNRREGRMKDRPENSCCINPMLRISKRSAEIDRRISREVAINRDLKIKNDRNDLEPNGNYVHRV